MRDFIIARPSALVVELCVNATFAEAAPQSKDMHGEADVHDNVKLRRARAQKLLLVARVACCVCCAV